MARSLTCPQCGSAHVRRSGRVGWLERLVSLAYVYPFRCQQCFHRFRALRWRRRYVRRAVH